MRSRFWRRDFELDRRAFEEIYDRHSRGLLGFLVGLTRDPDVALDLLAETFAQALLDRRKFRGATQEEALAWIYGIARHQTASYYRRGKAERRALKRLGVESPQWEEMEYERVEELASSAMLRTRVARELGSLPAGQRDVIELRVVAEIPYAEIAAQLGVDERAVRMRVSRGLRRMALELSSESTGGGDS